jgi:myo-inositol-1(or 4)-monophosphatase
MDRPPASDLLAVAHEAARAAGDLLVPRFGRERALRSKSTPTDLVSEADLAAERAIRDVLARHRPEDGVLGEESTGDAAGTSGLLWVVDPLDGTVNYLYGYPQWSVSVAVRDEHGMTLAGVVLDPVHGEAFAATHDGPATLNGEPIEASTLDDLSQALVATGFGYDAHVRRAQARSVSALLPEVRDIRRAGSAALDLCWAATGRVDAYYERGVQEWDVAAGLLVAARAGLSTWTLDADGADTPRGVLVAPPAIGEALLAIVR